VPLIQDKPFIKDVTIELAYRYSDYSNAGTTNTYKVSGDWTVFDGFRIRAGYNRAVRAPNVVELFSPQNVVLDGTVDPCAGLTAGNPLVQRCASLFNLTTAQVLALQPDPANQYNGRTGGNPNLRPEKADTYTVGFVWQPPYIPGLNFTVDWFNIQISDYIANIGANTIINGCVNGTNPDFCPLVVRDAIGSIHSNQGFVIDTELNQGGLETTGVDISAGYRTGLDRFGIQNMGSVSANFVGTYLDKLAFTVLNGQNAIDCAGLYGATCTGLGGGASTNPNNRWRHKLRLTWNTPYEWKWMSNLALSAQWRYLSSVDVDQTSSDPKLKSVVAPTDRTLGSRSYLDLLATFKLKDNYSLRFGVNNVLDQDPPLTGAGGTNPAGPPNFVSNCPSLGCNQNVYAQTYDALGRYFFMGVTADF
jgi:outer membrane receptor protein involved in Fe transport